MYTRNPVFGLCDQSMPTQLQKQSALCLHYLSSSVRLGISVLKFRTFTVCECVYLFCLFVCVFVELKRQVPDKIVLS